MMHGQKKYQTKVN